MRPRLKLTGQQVARAGEHLVAAEIHLRGAYAAMFTGNMPGVDLLASDAERSRGVQILDSVDDAAQATESACCTVCCPRG